MQNMFNILLKKEMGKFLFLKICHKVFKKRLLIFHIGSFYKKSFNRQIDLLASKTLNITSKTCTLCFTFQEK